MKKLGIFLLALAIGLCGCSAPQTAPPSLEPESGSISATEKAVPPQGAPVSLNYEYDRRELWAQRDGKRIYGEIFVPKDAGKKLPAVIFSHGFGGSYQVGAPYAQGLAARGYVVYCFDFCGGSPGSKSDGSTLEMSIFTEQPAFDLGFAFDLWGLRGGGVSLRRFRRFRQFRQRKRFSRPGSYGGSF